MSFNVDTATLAGLFASSIVYGIALVLLLSAIHVLLNLRQTLRPNYLLILAAGLMIILNTVILALSFSRVLDAFVYLRESTGGPVAFLDMFSQWKEVARTSCTSAYIFVADLTLIYRCWIVWSRSYRAVAVPIIVLIVYTVMSCLLNVNMAHLPQGASIFDPAVKLWIVAALVFSLVQNVIVNCMIVYKIVSVNRRATGIRSGTLRSSVQIIVESGMLYSITVFTYVITYVANSNGQFVMIDILNPVIGVTFALLVVRVAMRRPTLPKSIHSNPSSPEAHRQSRSVVIAIEQTTTVDRMDSTYDLETYKQAESLTQDE